MPIIWIGFIVVGLIGIICLIRSHFELHRLVVTEYEIASPKLEQIWDGYRIAVLGDLHNNEFGENNQTLLGAVKEAKPDIILVVGDLMVVKEWKEKDFSITDTILKGLSEIAPVYYANGNHELRMEQSPAQYPGWNEEFQQILKKYQIKVSLENGEQIKTVNMTTFVWDETFRIPTEFYDGFETEVAVLEDGSLDVGDGFVRICYNENNVQIGSEEGFVEGVDYEDIYLTDDRVEIRFAKKDNTAEIYAILVDLDFNGEIYKVPVYEPKR